MNKIDIMGIKFDNATLSEATANALEFLKGSEKGYVVTPNAEIAYSCRGDDQLYNIVRNANFILPDGIGVIYASKILSKPLKEKVAGIDFASSIMADKSEKTLFLLGGGDSIANNAKLNIEKQYPHIKVVGTLDGYFKDDIIAVDAINATGGVDIVFVCLGSPKQEKFISDNIDKINAKLLCGFGGILDVFSGNINRAPKVFIKLNLEWFYRLLKQPSRLGRMMKLPLYIISVLRYKVRGE